MPLLALRVRVPQQAADALSDALLEQGAQSVSIEALDDPEVWLSAIFTGSANPAHALEEALAYCGARAAGRCTVRALEDRDWARRSQAHFAPLRIGRLWIGASWHVAPADCVCVRLDPGLAFGTGSHASTRLVLAYLDRVVRGGEAVLDYGCGSGILAIAAAKLGAARIDAVDNDPIALEVARDNARGNAVELRVFAPEAQPPDRYDLVVANILARPLTELAPRLAGHAQRGAAIALSGLLASQAEEVQRAYATTFELGITARAEDWVLLSGVRR
ncbi:MAG TPA: 50S ribosomal protein L11 methyltransferase [Burkholderiales bacterium]|nr:50S ribosomal protein L11 methyltransferase [Burkholderiales bacterium]